jgi:hypothetical protein
MKKYLYGLFISLLLTVPSFAETAKPDSIRLLMEKSGSKDLGLQVMKQLIPMLKQLAPDAPDSFWREVMQEIDMDEMVNLLIPIYQKHLNEQDIQDIINFYDTQAGKKLIRSTPYITQESMLVGQKWGESIAQRVINKLKNEKQ